MSEHRVEKEAIAVDWQIRAIRGATTVSENSAEAIAQAVTEMLDAVESQNQLDPSEIVSVTFSVTRDLDAIFPAAIARTRPQWDNVPLLDVQQMHVQGSLPLETPSWEVRAVGNPVFPKRRGKQAYGFSRLHILVHPPDDLHPSFSTTKRHQARLSTRCSRPTPRPMP